MGRVTRAVAQALPPGVRTALRWAAAQLARVGDPHVTRSYAQEGEDMILLRLFEQRAEPGFYVDVGAHHPERFSNTLLLYERGWRGINIEPNPSAAAAFRRLRPRDVNLAVGVSDRTGELTYFAFNEPALNSFDEAHARLIDGTNGYHIVSRTPVGVVRLDAVLQRHLPPGTPIDVLSVDVEGHDAAVLRSNDWSRFRPHYVLVEAIGASVDSATRGESHAVLSTHGYSLIAKTVHTLIYRDARRPAEGHPGDG